MASGSQTSQRSTSASTLHVTTGTGRRNSPGGDVGDEQDEQAEEYQAVGDGERRGEREHDHHERSDSEHDGVIERNIDLARLEDRGERESDPGERERSPEHDASATPLSPSRFSATPSVMSSNSIPVKLTASRNSGILRLLAAPTRWAISLFSALTITSVAPEMKRILR